MDTDNASLEAFPRIQDVVPGGDLRAFFENVWGSPTVHAWSVNNNDVNADAGDVLLARLRDGFCGGDVKEVVRQCRKEDNAVYTPEEASNLQGDLENGGGGRGRLSRGQLAQLI